MGEYTEGIERINIELSLRNKLALVDALEAFFSEGNLPLGKSDDAGEIASAELLEDRVQQALALLREVRGLWKHWMTPDSMWCSPSNRAAAAAASSLTCRTTHCAQAGRRRSARRCRTSSPGGVRAHPGECNAIHQRVLKGRVWVALHMHAGDGNVHTNIPVNSDDYEMLQAAHGAVKRIMALARSLDGVISGEHGIGITKLEFLSDAEMADFSAYKQRWTPKGVSTRAS